MLDPYKFFIIIFIIFSLSLLSLLLLLLSLLLVTYPGSSAQQRSQCSTRISAGADVGCGSLK